VLGFKICILLHFEAHRAIFIIFIGRFLLFSSGDFVHYRNITVALSANAMPGALGSSSVAIT